MQINRQALIFGGGLLFLALLIAGGVWVASLFTSSVETNSGSTDNLFSSLFPFGDGEVARVPVGRSEEQQSGTSAPIPKLREVSRKPVSGAHFDSFGTIRYVDRETGHFFETRPNSLDTVRISNSTVPGIEHVSWLSDEEFALQYLDEAGVVKNYVGRLASSTPDQLLSGAITDTITDVLSTNERGRSLFVSQGDAGTTADIASLRTGTGERLFSSPLRSWKVFFAGANVLVQTAPSSGPGYLYRTNGTELERLLSGPSYFVSLPHPDGVHVAYSVNEGGAPVTRVTNTTTGAEYLIPIKALAYKCAWFSDAEPLLLCADSQFPDGLTLESWFMGVTALNDNSVWILDPFTGVAETKSSLEKDAGRPLDIIDLTVSPDGRYALFRNKTDLSLWSLTLD